MQVQTNLTQMGETKLVAEIPDADDINHIVVFMTGTTPFPDGMGAAGTYHTRHTGFMLRSLG